MTSLREKMEKGGFGILMTHALDLYSTYQHHLNTKTLLWSSFDTHINGQFQRHVEGCTTLAKPLSYLRLILKYGWCIEDASSLFRFITIESIMDFHHRNKPSLLKYCTLFTKLTRDGVDIQLALKATAMYMEVAHWLINIMGVEWRHDCLSWTCAYQMYMKTRLDLSAKISFRLTLLKRLKRIPHTLCKFVALQWTFQEILDTQSSVPIYTLSELDTITYYDDDMYGDDDDEEEMGRVVTPRRIIPERTPTIQLVCFHALLCRALKQSDCKKPLDKFSIADTHVCLRVCDLRVNTVSWDDNIRAHWRRGLLPVAFYVTRCQELLTQFK